MLQDELTEALGAQANAAGGWGYYRGNASRIEPTCWAVLALGSGARSPVDPHLKFLSGCQRADGLLSDRADLPVNLSWTALGFLTLSAVPAPAAAVDVRERMAEAITRTAGLALANTPAFRQNNMLQGWPWNPETFSWVEPTSWCVLALKQAIRLSPALATDKVRRRIADGEAILVDRVCETGGWNFGNSNAFGTNLPAHVPTSAIGLLALQDKPDSAVVRRSLAFVEQHWRKELSGTALALSMICLRTYGRPTDEIQAAIGDQWRHTRFLENAATTAMACCALTMNTGAKAALNLS